MGTWITGGAGKEHAATDEGRPDTGPWVVTVRTLDGGGYTYEVVAPCDVNEYPSVVEQGLQAHHSGDHAAEEVEDVHVKMPPPVVHVVAVGDAVVEGVWTDPIKAAEEAYRVSRRCSGGEGLYGMLLVTREVNSTTDTDRRQRAKSAFLGHLGKLVGRNGS